MITYIFLQRTQDNIAKYETKYPKLIKFINYYKNTTLIYQGLAPCFALAILALALAKQPRGKAEQDR